MYPDKVRITKEEEAQYFKEYYETKNLQVLQPLFLSLMGIFGKKIMALSESFNIELEDVQQDFLLRVTKAVKDFDNSYKYRFSTYVGTIINTMGVDYSRARESGVRGTNYWTISETALSKQDGDDESVNFWELVEDKGIPKPEEVHIYSCMMAKLNECLDTDKKRQQFDKYIINAYQPPKSEARAERLRKLRLRGHIRESFKKFLTA